MQPPLLAKVLGPPQVGIRYGNVSFTEPLVFPPPLLAPIQGLYVIMVRDTRFGPRPFRLLYVGETTNLSQRVCEQHEKYDDWKREAGGAALYYAYAWSSNWTERQRKDAEEAIIVQHDPPCNILLRRLGSLLRRA